MSRQKVSERPSYRNTDLISTPRKDEVITYNKYVLSEWKLAFYGLIASLIIITGKLYYLNRSYIHELIFERELVSLEQVSKEGEVVLRNVWVESMKYSEYWFPVLCGLLTTYFTWLMVYLDSNVPGVQPPTPLSPSKYKLQSGHIFHLNYVFALLAGILVSSYLYWKGVSL